jgi:hypothetical protein
LGDAVGQPQHLGVALSQERPSPLIAAILGGQLAKTGSLFGGNHKGARAPLLAAADDPGFMKLAARATTAGFATAALLKIKGAWGHEIVALEVSQGSAGGLVRTPEQLTEFRQVFGHLHAIYYIACRFQA